MRNSGLTCYYSAIVRSYINAVEVIEVIMAVATIQLSVKVIGAKGQISLGKWLLLTCRGRL